MTVKFIVQSCVWEEGQTLQLKLLDDKYNQGNASTTEGLFVSFSHLEKEKLWFILFIPAVKKHG